MKSLITKLVVTFITTCIATLALSACSISKGQWFPEPISAMPNSEADDTMAAGNEMGTDKSQELNNQVSEVSEPQESAKESMVETAEVASSQSLTKPAVNSKAKTELNKHPQVVRVIQPRVQVSKKQQIRESVKNDYYVLQALNHEYIKTNTADAQYKKLEVVLDHFVMDLVANIDYDMFNSSLVVRPMTVNLAGKVAKNSNKDLITSMLAKKMKEYGFIVFDARKPKGKFTGEELLLETKLSQLGEQYVLSGTLKLLSSNKMAATQQTFISDYFFKSNMQDGVAVYR